jgi:type IV pilus assembly protein PilB
MPEPNLPAPLPVIFELLSQKTILKESDIPLVLREQERRNCSYEEALLFAKAASEEDIARSFSEYFAIPLVLARDAGEILSPELKAALPAKLLRDDCALPLARKGRSLDVAFFNPTDTLLLEKIQLYTGLRVNVRIAPFSFIQKGLDLLYGAENKPQEMQDSEGDVIMDNMGGEDRYLDLDRIIPDVPATKIFRMVNAILSTALHEKASDVHLEPYEDEVRVRIRVDGVLTELPPPPVSQFIPLVSRFKILCKMDIAEKRLPQDGALTIKVGETNVDVRVSTVPTVYGEKMVLRLLNKEAVPLDLDTLGFDQRQREDFLLAAQSPFGLIFVTGPTGSGKSTTLYATLNLLQSPGENILTVEDPVEYRFRGINQVQVKPSINLKFADVMRSFLRQDPDIIMVGEVRDNETAEICLRAALTGHLVLSTLHTNNALSAVSRLMDMGIEPFLIASTLRMVQAQRLVRRLCPKCKEPYQPGEDMLKRFNLDKGVVLYRPKGCHDCRHTGYRGRIGIFEVYCITPELRDLIQERAPLHQLQEAARRAGVLSMLDDGVAKARQGFTSLEEIISTTVAT